jgi:hypothetical protein
MLNSGCKKKTFYCPSTAPRYTDDQNFLFNNSLWNFGGNGFNITGYSFAFNGASSKVNPIYQNIKIIPELHAVPGGFNQFLMDNASTRELITDVILSTANGLPATAANNYDNIVGGFTQNGAPYAHLSAHIRSRVPYGLNIGFKDGHVEWRKFNASSPNENNNTVKVRTGNNTPYFWW